MKIEFKNLLDESYIFQINTLNWRNSENVSKFFQIKEISLETHKNWLNLLKNKPEKQAAFVIYADKKTIGLVYFRNITKFDCDWGMYIYDESYRGMGIGQNTLTWSIDYAQNILKVLKIKLEVKEDNISAIKCYEKLGFIFKDKKTQEILKYEKEL